MSVDFQSYDLHLPAGGATRLPCFGQYARVQTATGKVTLRGQFGVLKGLSPGQGIKGLDFNEIIVEDFSGAANDVTIIVGPAEIVDQQIILASSSAIALDAPTLSAINASNAASNRIDNWTSWKSITVGSETVFTAAQNVNGAIVRRSTAIEYQSVGGNFGYIVKNSPPTSIVDGDAICLCDSWLIASNGYGCCSLKSEQSIKIPAGRGLFYFSSSSSVNFSLKNILYTLL